MVIEKISRIRWRQEDVDRLKKTINRYNYKLGKLIQKEGGAPDTVLPSKLTLRGVRKSIVSRKDLNREIARMERFLKPGAEKLVQTHTGVYITQFEKKEAERDIKTVNAYRKRRKEKIKQVAQNESVLQSLEKNPEYRARTIQVTDVKQGMLRDYIDTLKKQASDKAKLDKDLLYRDNYLKAAYQEFGNTAAYRELRKIIMGMPLETLISGYYYSVGLSIEYAYTEENKADRLNHIIELWKEYLATGEITE